MNKKRTWKRKTASYFILLEVLAVNCYLTQFLPPLLLRNYLAVTTKTCYTIAIKKIGGHFRWLSDTTSYGNFS